MKVVANKSLGTTSLIAIELSKAYLYRALRCKDSDSDSIYCLANVYLAVCTTPYGDRSLYTGDEVTRSLTGQLVCCTETGRTFTEDWRRNEEVDNVSRLGLSCVLPTSSIRTASLNQRYEAQHVSVLTTELFAYYLHYEMSVTYADIINWWIQTVWKLLLVKWQAYYASVDRWCHVRVITSLFWKRSCITICNSLINWRWIKLNTMNHFSKNYCRSLQLNISQNFGRLWFCNNYCHKRIWGACTYVAISSVYGYRILWKKTQNKGYYAVQVHSRLFEVGTNRKPVCDFLLVINSNWHPISYRLRVIAAYCSNVWYFAFLSHLLGGLGKTYDVHHGLIRKRVVDFLLVLTEPFSLGVTVESLRARIDRNSAISLQRGQFDSKFQVEGVAPTNHFCTDS